VQIGKLSRIAEQASFAAVTGPPGYEHSVYYLAGLACRRHVRIESNAALEACGAKAPQGLPRRQGA